MDEKVEAAYKKVMALAAGTGEYTMGSTEELDVVVSELMIAVMELTEEKLNAVHERVRREALDEEHLSHMAVIRLRGSLMTLQHSLEAPQTDLRSS